jgi:hypothetical protein
MPLGIWQFKYFYSLKSFCEKKNKTQNVISELKKKIKRRWGRVCGINEVVRKSENWRETDDV